MSNGFAGMMIWSIEQDDFTNLCGGWNIFGITAAVKSRLEFHNKLSMSAKEL